MRNVVSPLSGIRSPFGGRSDLYKTAGFRPEFVADFGGEYYRANLSRSTFADTLTHAATTNATMVDSDGLLKWRPHNLLTDSEAFDPSTTAWSVDNSGATNPTVTDNYGTAPDGTVTADRLQLDKTGGSFSRLQQVESGLADAEYTFAVWMTTVSGSTENVGLRIGATGVNCAVTGDWQLFTVSGETTTPSSQILLFDSIVGNDETADVLVWGAHLYRSDLGGMVNNPDRGDSYVPTTSSAVYMPRRGHHIWNGSAWVNAGYFHEKFARTNLITHSEDLTDASWTPATLTLGNDTTTSPTGEAFSHYITSTSAGAGSFQSTHTVTATPHTHSWFVKYYDNPWVRVGYETSAVNAAWFNIQTGEKGTIVGAGNTSEIEDIGGGWYRISIHIASPTTSSTIAFVALSDADNSTVQVTGQSAYIWGPQFEEGSEPSSHIPTNGAAATRAAETLTAPSANLPWGSAVSIQMEGLETFADEGSATQELLFDWRADANNRITLALDTDSAKVGTLTLTMVNGGSSATISTTAELTPGVNDPFNVAFVCTSNELGIALDGVAETRVSHAIGLPDLSAEDATFGGNGTRDTARIWADDIGDTGLEQSTS